MTSDSKQPLRRATIRDVAKEAGVAISTVSHALSGQRTISAATKERVLEAAETLGYGPHPAARSLRTGRAGMIGLILRPRDAVHGSVQGTETFNRLSGAAATEALERKVGLVHVPDILDPAVQAVPMDGCIVAHPYGDDDVLTELMRRDVPVVTVEEDPDRPGFTWSVVLDYRPVLIELLDQLRRQGARRIVLLTGTEDNAWNRRSQEIYVEWVKRYHLRAEHLSLYEGEGVGGAERLMAPKLSGAQRPDAVVASASRFAAGIVDAAADVGLKVPDDLMVAALTDSEFTRSHSPPITAIDLILERLAAAAVDLLLSRLDGASAPSHPVTLPPTLHQRRSTQRR